MKKINLNEKIKKLLKSNHLEEYKKGENKKNDMIYSIRTINRDCFDAKKFDSNIKEEINSERKSKKKNFDSISANTNTKLSELNYISLKIKNKRSKYQNKLIYTEPLNYRSHGKKRKVNNSFKSYNLYKLISSNDKLSIGSSSRNKKKCFIENSKLNNKKNFFGFNEKFNEILPLLTHHISKKKF